MLQDRTHIRRFNVNANLAAIRCCLITLRAQFLTHLKWLQIIETAQRLLSCPEQAISNHDLK
jgi:hypothetical protein